MAVGTAPFFGWAVVIEGTPNSFENPSPWGVPLPYEVWEGDLESNLVSLHPGT